VKEHKLGRPNSPRISKLLSDPEADHSSQYGVEVKKA
jgi:hypothetical protein